MICPVVVASDLAAFKRAGRLGTLLKRGVRDVLPRLRRGAGHADSGSGDACSDGSDPMAPGSGDPGGVVPNDPAMEGALRGVRLRRVHRSSPSASKPEAGTGGDDPGGGPAVSATLRGPARQALPREARGGARDHAELHLGEDRAAECRPGGAPVPPEQAPAAPTAAAAAGDA